ncbi:hypothetical protein DMUE_4200 [Dictyocoela muelleri]|nr:hypothetical protein DMUE_4200 [Dictyocoela muelleri]
MFIKFQKNDNLRDNNKLKISMFKLSANYLLFFYFSGSFSAWGSYLYDHNDFLILPRNRNSTFGGQSVYVHKEDGYESGFSESFVQKLLQKKGIRSVIYLEYSKSPPTYDGEFEDQFQLLVHEIFIYGESRTSKKRRGFLPNHILIRECDLNYVTTQSSLG